MSTAPEQEGHSTSFAPQRSGDTHSYKGWLNSDSFLKRAFAVLGYSTVASLILYIPIVIIAVALGAGGMLFMGDSFKDEMREDLAGEYGGNPYEEEYAPSPDAGAKLDIRAVCEGALAYMTFPDGASSDAFVEDCVAGDHPEVIEQYKMDMGITDDTAI